jgi:predicted permease
MPHDLRYGLRMLAKSPAFTIIAAFSLALGIGANTAIFSMVNVILLRPVPVSEPDRLVSVFMLDERNPGNLPFSHLNYKDVRDQNQVFSGVAAFTFAQLNWSHATESEQIAAQVVSGNYFSLLGVEPALGRAFMPEEDEKPTPVVVVSHGFWERSLGSDPAIVGRTLTLNRTPFTVVGVGRRGFTGTLLGGGPSVWVPMSMHHVVQPNFNWYEQRRGLFLFAVGRLAPNVSVDQASANLKTVFAQLAQAYPNDNKGRSAGAVPLLQARLNPQGIDGDGGGVVQISMILMTVVGIVLLIACANIANLLLARANKRRREIAVRLALGANRARLVRQLLTESTLLSLFGAALGLLLAQWLLGALIGADLPLPLPVGEEVSLDGRVLAFTAALAIATGVLFGLAPALQASRADVVPVLKNENVPSGDGRRGRVLGLRQILVVVQIALSLVSLVAAGLFVRSLQGSHRIDPGFETSGVLVMNFNLGREGYTPERGQGFYREIAERVSTLPGVRRAAVAQSAPLDGGLRRSVMPEGADTTTQDRILVQVNSVSPGYLDAMGIPLERGRDFTDTDEEGTPKVVIVNETMAARFWPGEDATGKRFKFFGDDDFTTVIGIARDAKYNAVAEDPTPFIYQPLRQNYSPAAVLHVRAAGAAGLAAAVRREVQQLDPTLSVFDVRTLEDQVSDSLGPLRINVILLSIFGLLALVLASVGLYGVASYSVTQRTREIGVRMALGAPSSTVLRLVLVRGLVLVAVGLATGVAVAFVLSVLIPADLLTNVGARDPLTFAATSALLGGVALIASFIPAWRATRIDPLVALRTD